MHITDHDPSLVKLQVTAGSLFGVPASAASSTVAKPAAPKALSTGTLAVYGTSGLPDTATYGVQSAFSYACTGGLSYAVYDGGKLTLTPTTAGDPTCTFTALDMTVSGDLAAISTCCRSMPVCLRLCHEQNSNHLCSAGSSATFKNDDVSCTLNPTTTGTGLVYAVTSADGATKYKIGYKVSSAATATATVLILLCKPRLTSPVPCRSQQVLYLGHLSVGSQAPHQQFQLQLPTVACWC